MKYLLVALTLCFLACKDSSKSSEIVSYPEIRDDLMPHHMGTLAGDAFEGRKPCTKGEEHTVGYLRDALFKAGVEPGNGDSYFQEVPLLEITGEMSNNMLITTNKKEMILDKGKDFVVHTQRKQEQVALQESDLVFCGYGIVDESQGWNDFAGVDMKGKTAVVLVNDPGFGGEDSSFFKGNTMTYFGRWTYKYEEADRQGAAGLLIIHETASAGYPWFVVQSSWTGGQQGLDKGDKKDDCSIKGWISLDVAKELFTSSGLDLGEQIRNARKPAFKPVPLHAKVSVKLNNTFKTAKSKNVIGIIKGTKYPDEYIVYTAHWDHLGIGKKVDDDDIYNGALDNASGTATVLSIAHAMGKSEIKPERSIVFLFVTAEEQGLLGSEYYCDNPIFPLEKTVCNLNMDGVNPIGKMKDFTITGKGHSEMDEIIEEEANKMGRYTMNESEPEKGFFFRSDQFNFAKKGVPVMYGEGSYEHWDKGVEYVADFKKNYTNQNYHQPSDEYDPETWNMETMIQDGQLYLNVGWRMASSREWPKWYPNSEFKR